MLTLFKMHLSNTQTYDVIISKKQSVVTDYIANSFHKKTVLVQKQAECTFMVLDENNGIQSKEIELYVTLEQDAVLQMLVYLTHTESVTCIIHVHLAGQNAVANVQGVYALADNQNIIIKTYQHHAQSDGKSTLSMKGMLKNLAKISYEGMIRIDDSAKGTYAAQENKNIVLSKQAKVVSVPSIEVLQHDVQCFHGSAIGKFDKQHLWYLQSKGLSYKQAYNLLVQSFFKDVLNDFDQSGELLGVLCQKMISKI